MKRVKQRLNAKNILMLLKQREKDIARFDVSTIGLFGSFLKGNETGKSDVDILVKFNTITFDNYMDLKFYLEKLFGRKVDLVIERSLKPALRYIKREALYA